MKTKSISLVLALILSLIALPVYVADVGPGYNTYLGGAGDGSLLFIENVGQFDARARFQVRGGPGTLWLAEDALWLTLVDTSRVELTDHLSEQSKTEPYQAVNLKLSFLDANPHPRLEPFDRQDNVIHYYRGNDPSQWRTDVSVWGGVRYVDLYPGVDLEITGESGRWVWRLVCRADCQSALQQTRLLVEGSETVTVQDGYLHLTTGVGDFTLPLLAVEEGTLADRPAATRTANETFEVAAPFSTIAPGDAVSSQTVYPEEAYFGSYLGGNAWDWPYDIAISGQGDILDRGADNRAVWIAGWTTSSNFPTAPGSTSLSGSSDAFVTKMRRGAVYVAPAFSAYIGGSDQDGAQAIATDASGNVYVAGWTRSSDFATTGNPYDATFNGCVDAFVLKLDSDGNLLYASYLGGSHVTIPGLGDQCGDDSAAAIAVDAQGIIYLTGSTYSQDFPTTPGAYDTVFSYFDVGLNKDTFIAKLDLSKGASGLLYSTFVGGGTPSQGEDIAIDKNGNVYVTGNAEGGPDGRNFFPTTPGAYNEVFTTGDVGFFFKLNPGGNGVVDLLYSTFLGGADGSGGYGNTSIALDAAGHAYVYGTTNAPNFPTTSGAFDTTCGTDGNCNGGYADAFIAKLNPGGNGSADLLYSTFLGGKYQDEGADIALGTNGDVYVTGRGVSEGFPITSDAYASNTNEFFDVFVTRLRFQGAGGDDLVYSTAVGGSWNEKGIAIVLDEDDRVYVVGETISSNFPTTAHALYKNYIGGEQDAFVFRLLTPPAPDLSTSTKRVEPTEAIVGDIVTYTVQLVNSGTLSATVAVTDTLPATLIPHGTPAASSGPSPVIAGQTLAWAGTVTEATTVLITYAAELTSTTTLTPTIRNIAQIDDGVGNVYMRSAFVNWEHIYLPLVLRNYAP